MKACTAVLASTGERCTRLEGHSGYHRGDGGAFGPWHGGVRAIDPLCTRCGGTRTVNLGTRSDAEYWPCPDCQSHDSGSAS